MEAGSEIALSLPQRIWKTYKIPLVLSAFSIVSILFSAVLLIKSMISTTPITFVGESASSSAVLGVKIFVDIEGAVTKPGVYRLNKGARVEEAIAASGGFTSEANFPLISKTINRAQILTDGAKIFIPSDIIVRREDQPNSVESLINVNLASLSELDSLPGVGPATAQKIISGRPYQSLDELVAKKAVSESLFVKIKDRLSL